MACDLDTPPDATMIPEREVADLHRIFTASHVKSLSRDRTFRTLFRTAPDIPDTFSDIFPDTFGQHTGQLPDIIGHFTGHDRT